jgi:hypothetical protein
MPMRHTRTARTHRRGNARGWIALLATAATLQVFAAEADAPLPMRVLWGDTHVHTSWSSDSYLFGNRQLSPEHAYLFARGEPVTATNGDVARLARALDFVVVADHAENLGMMARIAAGDPALMSTPNAARWRELLGEIGAGTGAFGRIFRELGNPQLQDDAARRAIWRDYVAMADAANAPGVFTALVGYEWTSTGGGNNLHRVVVFRDGGEVVQQMLPYAEFDSGDPEQLWRHLAEYNTRSGREVLAIPHNGNGSNGLMFPETMRDGALLDADYASRRQRWEPLMEVVQIKGDSESHPLLSPDDAFAGYSVWDKGNLLVTARKEPGMLRHEYARAALGLGIEVAARTGVNPYRFGMIGSTDSHTSLSTADDDNFWGGNPDNEPGPGRMARELIASTVEPAMSIMAWEQEAAGYAAVWARDNTREAIFDAMQRREVYASTGPRITLRFFGGWNYGVLDHRRPDYAERGYAGGVPMGGELRPVPEAMTADATGKPAPRFMVAAMKDASGANLDRVQIVKGWLDADGRSHERVHDVAWSGERVADASGKLPPLASSIDATGTNYSNSVGAAELATVWIDPDFDPSVHAFYYVRVLEIETPRWVAYDAARYGASVPEGARRAHQERVYSSPIWYVPDK